MSVTCAGRWFSLGTPISSTNKSDRPDKTEILLKVALNIIALILTLKDIMRDGRPLIILFK
jgi:hypothetical protein